MVSGRYGAGRVFFCGTDDTWRWRRGDGEWVFDTFWLQVCRSLTRPRSLGADRRVVLRTDRSRYEYGERVELSAEVVDGELLAVLGEELHALVRDGLDRPVRRVTLARLGERANVFEGWFVPDRAGSYGLELEDYPGRLGQRRASAMIHVADADVELRRSEADRATLARLASETGGAVLVVERIVEDLGSIRDRSVQIPDDVSEPLWDSKLALAMFSLLLVSEWVLRKAFGML